MRLADYRRVEGKTLSFFANELPFQSAGARFVDDLYELSKANNDCNLRVCLHSSPAALYHDMIILEWCGHYFPPHRHGKKSETIHMIRGALDVYTFDEQGAKQSSTFLNKDDDFLWRVDSNIWHFTVPVSYYTIYHESKPGPFLGEADREFSPFAPPQGADPALIQDWMKTLWQKQP